MFVPGRAPQRPSEPGGYIWMPSGCPKKPFYAQTYWRFLEGFDTLTCVEAQRKYARWCGVEDATTIFIQRKPTIPKKPGCYVWMPAGCTQHPFPVPNNTRSSIRPFWRLDGERNNSNHTFR